MDIDREERMIDRYADLATKVTEAMTNVSNAVGNIEKVSKDINHSNILHTAAVENNTNAVKSIEKIQIRWMYLFGALFVLMVLMMGAVFGVVNLQPLVDKWTLVGFL